MSTCCPAGKWTRISICHLFLGDVRVNNWTEKLPSFLRPLWLKLMVQLTKICWFAVFNDGCGAAAPLSLETQRDRASAEEKQDQKQRKVQENKGTNVLQTGPNCLINNSKMEKVKGYCCCFFGTGWSGRSDHISPPGHNAEPTTINTDNLKK